MYKYVRLLLSPACDIEFDLDVMYIHRLLRTVSRQLRGNCRIVESCAQTGVRHTPECYWMGGLWIGRLQSSTRYFQKVGQLP